MHRAQPVKPVGEDRRAAWLPGSDLLQRPRWGHTCGAAQLGGKRWTQQGLQAFGRSGQELADRKEPLLGVWSLAGRTGASEFMWNTVGRKTSAKGGCSLCGIGGQEDVQGGHGYPMGKRLLLSGSTGELRPRSCFGKSVWGQDDSARATAEEKPAEPSSPCVYVCTPVHTRATW